MKALTTLLTDIADAIREKRGTTELINPQDFSSEIRGISGGGNSGGVTSSWRYFDVSKVAEEDKVDIVSMFAQIIRAVVNTNDVICPPKTQDLDLAKTSAFGFDSSMPYRNMYMEGVNTIGELYAIAGGDEAFNELGIIEITEDEFLNKQFE